MLNDDCFYRLSGKKVAAITVIACLFFTLAFTVGFVAGELSGEAQLSVRLINQINSKANGKVGPFMLYHAYTRTYIEQIKGKE